MDLEKRINADIMSAMKAQEKLKLEALRSIKAGILIAKTAEGGSGEVSEEEGIKILQKMAKQRRDSAEIFTSQNRQDLAEKELAELSVIEVYLPAPMSQEELRKEIEKIIAEAGASSIKDMGKVMGMASKQLAGKIDGKQISEMVKEILSAL